MTVEELLLSTTRPGVRARASLRDTARRFAHLSFELTQAMVDEIAGLASVQSKDVGQQQNEPPWLQAHRVELKVSLAKMQDTLNRQSIRRGEGCDGYLSGPFRRWGGQARRRSEQAVSHPLFDQFIMLCICVNCVFLAMADPTTDVEPQYAQVVGAMFLYIFTLEVILKVLAFGAAYPKDYWNWLDVVVVLEGWITALGGGGSSLQGLKTFRILRPLRVANRMPSVKMIISALLGSLPAIMDTFVVFFFFLFIFAMLCCTLWSGTLTHRCAAPDGAVRDEEQLCFPRALEPEGAFCSALTLLDDPYTCGAAESCVDVDEAPAAGGINFDNILFGILTLFSACTMEGWSGTLFYTQAVMSEGTFFVFLAIIVVGNFTIINIMIASILVQLGCLEDLAEEMRVERAMAEGRAEAARVAELERRKEALRNGEVLPPPPLGAVLDRCATDVGLIAKAAVWEASKALCYDGLSRDKPVGHWATRLRWFAVDDTSPFSYFVQGCILFNMLILALDGHGIPDDLANFLTVANLVLTGTFCFEMAFKLAVIGVLEYFLDPWCRFDALIVSGSVVEILLASGSSSIGVLRVMRVLRLTRVARLARLVQKWASLRSVFSRIHDSASKMGPVLLLLVLFMFIFSILGMTMFGALVTSDDFVRFDNFYTAFVQCFYVILGEGWVDIMYVSMADAGPFAAVYFVLLVMVGNFVLVNLILAVVLGGALPADMVKHEIALRSISRAAVLHRLRHAVGRWRWHTKRARHASLELCCLAAWRCLGNSLGPARAVQLALHLGCPRPLLAHLAMVVDGRLADAAATAAASAAAVAAAEAAAVAAVEAAASVAADSPGSQSALSKMIEYSGASVAAEAAVAAAQPAQPAAVVPAATSALVQSVRRHSVAANSVKRVPVEAWTRSLPLDDTLALKEARRLGFPPPNVLFFQWKKEGGQAAAFSDEAMAERDASVLAGLSAALAAAAVQAPHAAAMSSLPAGLAALAAPEEAAWGPLQVPQARPGVAAPLNAEEWGDGWGARRLARIALIAGAVAAHVPPGHTSDVTDDGHVYFVKTLDASALALAAGSGTASKEEADTGAVEASVHKETKEEILAKKAAHRVLKEAEAKAAAKAAAEAAEAKARGEGEGEASPVVPLPAFEAVTADPSVNAAAKKVRALAAKPLDVEARVKAPAPPGHFKAKAAAAALRKSLPPGAAAAEALERANAKDQDDDLGDAAPRRTKLSLKFTSHGDAGGGGGGGGGDDVDEKAGWFGDVAVSGGAERRWLAWRALSKTVVATSLWAKLVGWCMIVSCVTMINTDDQTPYLDGWFILDTLCNLVFVAEVALVVGSAEVKAAPGAERKTVTGFAAYWSDGWNRLDLLIVLSTVASVVAREGNFDAAFGACSVVRAFRPLRFINRDKSLKDQVALLYKSVAGIGTLAVFLWFTMTAYAVVGMQLLKGHYYKCDDGDWSEDEIYMATVGGFPANSPRDGKVVKETGFYETRPCSGPYVDAATGLSLEAKGEWVNSQFHFDDFGSSLLAVFIMSVGGWADIVMDGLSATEVGYSPEPYANANFLVIWYFFFGISFFGLYILNEFVGVVFDTYVEEKGRQQEATTKNLKSEEVDTLELKARVDLVKPVAQLSKPAAAWRKALDKVAESKRFSTFVLCVIGLNAATLALAYDGQPDWLTALLDQTGVGFSVVFAVEAFIKLAGAGRVIYFSKAWNQFDFLVTVGSGLDSVLFLAGTCAGRDSTLLRLVRSMRIFRLMRLVSLIEGCEIIMLTCTFAWPRLVTVMKLLTILIFFFANVAVVFFEHYPNNYGSLYANFKTEVGAMQLLFILMTGDNWNNSMGGMMETAGSGTTMFFVVIAFFIIYLLIMSFVIMNLFVMVVCEAFEVLADDTKKDIERTVPRYQDAWSSLDPSASGAIPVHKLPGLIRQLPEPFGVKFPTDARELASAEGRDATQRCYKRLNEIHKFVEMNLERRSAARFNEVLFLLILMQRIEAGELKSPLYRREVKTVVAGVCIVGRAQVWLARSRHRLQEKHTAMLPPGVVFTRADTDPGLSLALGAAGLGGGGGGRGNGERAAPRPTFFGGGGRASLTSGGGGGGDDDEARRRQQQPGAVRRHELAALSAAPGARGGISLEPLPRSPSSSVSRDSLSLNSHAALPATAGAAVQAGGDDSYDDDDDDDDDYYQL